MPKTLTGPMATYIAGDAATLASCWQITLRAAVGGAVYGYTDWDRDITYLGVTYKTTTGYSRSAVSSKVDLSVPNLELTGLLNSAAIQESDIEAGLYDYASINVFLVNPNDLTMGDIKLRAGYLGQVTTVEGQYTAEMRGLAQLLDQTLIELYELDCRADFGDARCKFDLSTVRESGATSVISTARRAFTTTLSSGRASGYFDAGVVTWTGGANSGQSSDIKTWDGTTLTLYIPTGYVIAPGDAFTITPGCDKSSATCLSRWNNLVNHRGFPFIPGLDTYLYPNAALQYA